MRHRPTKQLALATVVALSLFAASCGDKASEPGGDAAKTACPVDQFKNENGRTEVILWHSFVGRTSATLQNIADSYNASQDKVTVKIENRGANYEELRRSYEQALGARKLPAIVAGEDTWTQFMIDNGATLAAQGCIDADKDPGARLDDLLPSVKAAYTVNGVQYPAAFGVSTIVLYYNKTAFKAAGLDPDKPPTTLAEVRTAAEKLKAAGQGPSGPLVMKMDPWYIEHLVTGSGETVVDHSNGRDGKPAERSTLDNPSVTTTLDFLSSMHRDGLLNAVGNAKQIDHYLAVATEGSSMLFETSTAITLIAGVVQGGLDLKKELGDAAGGFDIPADFKVGFEVGVANYPGISQAGKGQVGGSAWYITNTGSGAVQSAAWDFLKYFNSTDNQVIWTRDGSYLPVRDSAAKVLQADAAWASSLTGRWITTAYDGMKTLDPKFPGPVLGAYDAFRDNLAQAMEAVTIGNQDPATARATATATIDDAIEKYNANNF